MRNKGYPRPHDQQAVSLHCWDWYEEKNQTQHFGYSIG